MASAIERGTELGQAVLELAGRFVRPDRRAGDRDDAAGVDLGCHADDGDAALGFAVLDGAGDRGRASICRQDRAVEVDATELRNRQAAPAKGSGHTPP